MVHPKERERRTDGPFSSCQKVDNSRGKSERHAKTKIGLYHVDTFPRVLQKTDKQTDMVKTANR